MKISSIYKRILSLAAVITLVCGLLSACSFANVSDSFTFEPEEEADVFDTSDYLIVADEEPDTVDFQCTSLYYTVAFSCFNRLLEIKRSEDGSISYIPSLAKNWEISDDGCNYTFTLREGVQFSNGSPLTSSDVRYTMERLLTHPDSCNADIAAQIKGAKQLMNKETDHLEGFIILDDLHFVITLEKPFAAFLACLSMPGASILDETSTEAAGNSFGIDPKQTIGTGSYIMESWEPTKGILLAANKTCWEGEPGSAGIDLRFISDSEQQRIMFENGELDILDLDNLGNSAEFFIHGDIYQDSLYAEQRIGITYIALNESIEPLNNVLVRKALQISLNRQMLLDAVYSGRGSLENGIYPHGLLGYNPDLPGIPYDPDTAKELLKQAGYPDGFDLNIHVKSSSTMWEKELMTMAASMWEKIGIRAEVEVISEAEFMKLRKRGELACYTAEWVADYDDPDNFIYTFFGNKRNTTYRSLCYPRDDIMERVREARSITDADARIAEYQELEKTIIQDEAAWIPLYSRTGLYVIGERIEDLPLSWNGWISIVYRYIKMKQE